MEFWQQGIGFDKTDEDWQYMHKEVMPGWLIWAKW